MVHLRAVGESVIEVGDVRIGPDAELAFALLLVLALARGRPVARRQLTELLWPSASDDRARHNLRQTIYKLRQLGVPVDTESLHVRLAADAVAPNVLLDPELDGPPPAELLRPELPFGEFLAGYAPTFSAPFAAWVEEQRTVMHGRLRRLLLAVMLDERRRGNWGAVELLARRALQLDALNEEATLALAEATALAGSKHAAVGILDGYLRELGEGAGDIRLPAVVLRRRIAERLQPLHAPAASDGPFVGRAESVAFLAEQLRRTRAGSAGAVLVWGDAGIGKSRLLTEFARMAVLDGAQVARVGCQARDVDRPLSLFVDVVPVLLGLPGALGCSPESMAYLRRLTAHDPAVLEPSAATREAELLFANVRRAILDVVDAVASEAPLLLAFEDVHWLDEQSWRVLRELIGWVQARPVLVVLTSRLPHATPTPPARTAPGLLLHRLPGLSREASAALFDSATERLEPPESFRDWSLQVSDGNPLFLSTLAIHWLETATTNAPESIGRLMDVRLQRCSSACRRFMQASAILGHHASLPRIQQILQFSQAQLLDCIAEAAQHGFLQDDADAVRCRHSLVAQAALRSLTEQEVIAMHRFAAIALEGELRHNTSAALLWTCVSHWRVAREPDRAFALARAHAAHMVDIGIPEVAATVLEELSEYCTDERLRRICLEQRRDALQLSGRWEQLLNVLDQLQTMQLAPPGQPVGHTTDELLRYEVELRTSASMSDVLRRVTMCAADPNASVPHRRHAAALALQCADNLFDREAADAVYTCIRPYLEHADVDPSASLRIEAMYHNAFGSVDDAVGVTDEWLRHERRVAEPARLSRALRNAAIPYRTGGLVDKAFACLVESFEISARYSLASNAANTADVLATTNLSLGDNKSARAWYQQAVEWARRAEETPVTSSLAIVGARLLLAEERATCAEAALDCTLADADDDPALRRRLDRYGVLCAIDLATGRHERVALYLPRYLELHQRGRAFHGQDFSASALIAAHLTLGRVGEARQLLADYIRTRRERSPLAIEVQRLIAQMPAGGDGIKAIITDDGLRVVSRTVLQPED